MVGDAGAELGDLEEFWTGKSLSVIVLIVVDSLTSLSSLEISSRCERMNSCSKAIHKEHKN